eukprot:NODE_6211_length_912_cov_22.108999_g5619_i0.p1 GENE.NODE_6211_length_912_cov_22.108999_g5619_i0~~NODE_6211_length_912_cov_22.108999_g5619_i0.p1  ORF type:complete len:291 (-),score=52.71 NODE_6211_length_912_cov_22.108999_g5619_i0:40-864(-)
MECFRRFEMIEHCARVQLACGRIGQSPIPLTTQQLKEHNQYVNNQIQTILNKRTESKTSNPNDQEKEVRRELIDTIHRCYRQFLTNTSSGVFSARVNANTIIITPSSYDASSISDQDLISVELTSGSWTSYDTSSAPSPYLDVHLSIYNSHSSIDSIIYAQPLHTCALAATHSSFPSQQIPESYITLHNVNNVAFENLRTPKNLANTIDNRHPISIIDNAGVLVTGSSLRETFDRLEVMEAMAEVYIQTIPFGGPKLMSSNNVRTIETLFMGLP